MRKPCRPQRIGGVGLVRLHGDNGALGVCCPEQESYADDHVIGALQHHAMIGGEEGFALGAVDHEGVRMLALGDLQLGVRGKGRFSWPALAETHPSLSTQDLTLLLDGVEFKDRRKKPWHRG